ncbi:MAG TPA: hypothetical protein VH138_18425, partial [Vicinamibacterales bacterium]|nr:hypothetical protein [Vicinamibacterales bacterium]
MRTLRRALLAIAVFAFVAYGGAIVWLMANETRLVFQSGQAGAAFTPAPPVEEISSPVTPGPRLRIWVMRASAASD